MYQYWCVGATVLPLEIVPDTTRQQTIDGRRAMSMMEWTAVNDGTNASYIDKWSGISVSSSRRIKVMSKGRTQSQAPGRERTINPSIHSYRNRRQALIMPDAQNRKQKTKVVNVLLPRFFFGLAPPDSLVVSDQASSVGLALSSFYSSTNSFEICWKVRIQINGQIDRKVSFFLVFKEMRQTCRQARRVRCFRGFVSFPTRKRRVVRKTA